MKNSFRLAFVSEDNAQGWKIVQKISQLVEKRMLSAESIVLRYTSRWKGFIHQLSNIHNLYNLLPCPPFFFYFVCTANIAFAIYVLKQLFF